VPAVTEASLTWSQIVACRREGSFSAESGGDEEEEKKRREEKKKVKKRKSLTH
jgi:hypothetical protein